MFSHMFLQLSSRPQRETEYEVSKAALLFFILSVALNSHTFLL
jgi:hypothetical protein